MPAIADNESILPNIRREDGKAARPHARPLVPTPARLPAIQSGRTTGRPPSEPERQDEAVEMLHSKIARSPTLL